MGNSERELNWMVGPLVPEMGVATSCVVPTGWGQPTQWRVEGSEKRVEKGWRRE